MLAAALGTLIAFTDSEAEDIITKISFKSRRGLGSNKFQPFTVKLDIPYCLCIVGSFSVKGPLLQA